MARKVRDNEKFEFARDDVAKVAGFMDHLCEAAEGWINLLPGIPDDEETAAPPTALSALFGSGKPSVTMCTWVPPVPDRHGNASAKLGITHFYGQRVKSRLDSLSLTIPSTWMIEQDHPRRGLVVRIPKGESNATVLLWAIAAGEALCHHPLTGMWRAEVYFPYA